MSAAAVALVAGAGVGEILVHRRPRSPSSRPATRYGRRATTSGRPASPTPTVPAFARSSRRQAATPIDLGIATDDLDDVLGRLRRGLEAGADALIVSGGVSVGPYDVVKTAIETIGRIDLWRVAVQPGKPFAFGVADRPGGGAPVLLFGLPGNPVSSAVTFELFVRPAIRSLAGRHDLLRPVDRGVLGEPVTKSHGRRAFLRVEAERDETGAPDPRRTRSRARPPRGRAGEPRHLRPRRRRCPGRHPRGRRFAAGRRRGRTVVARPRMMGSPLIAQTNRTRPTPEEPMDQRPQPRAERRRLSHVDRAGRPRMVDVSGQAGHRPAGRRRGGRRRLARDDEPRHRRRRARRATCSASPSWRA